MSYRIKRMNPIVYLLNNADFKIRLYTFLKIIFSCCDCEVSKREIDIDKTFSKVTEERFYL